MTDSKPKIPILTLATLATVLAACEPTPQRPAESATPHRQPINQWVAPEKVPSFSADDLLLEGEDARTDALEKRFSVTREVAEAWAVNWVIGHRELQGQPQTCFYLPWRDAGGRLVAHQFVLSDHRDCSSFEALDREMDQIVREARDAMGTGQEVGEADLLRERTRISSRSFFTLAVSAYSFHHPLRDGIKGLPFWMIARDRLPERLRTSEHPPSVLHPVGNRNGLIEVIEYPAADDGFLFSHHTGAPVDRADLHLTFDIASVYRQWSAAVRQRYAGNVEERLIRHGNLWSRYLTGEER